MANTFVGCVACVLVNMTVFPIRAADAMRSELLNALNTSRECVVASFHLYHGTNPGTNPLPLIRKLQLSIATQSTLFPAAVAEPELWLPRFPRAIYRKLIRRQLRLERVLLIMMQTAYGVHRSRLLWSNRTGIPFVPAFDAIKDEVVRGFAVLTDALNSERDDGAAAQQHNALVAMHGAVFALRQQHEKWTLQQLQLSTEMHVMRPSRDILRLNSFVFAVCHLLTDVISLSVMVRELIDYELLLSNK